MSSARYTELQITSNFTFLRGGSHPEELVDRALALGYTEIAITDHNTLAGIVRAYTASKGKNIRIIPSCRLNLIDGLSLLAYPTTKEAYSRLSALLSEGNLRAEKGECHLLKADVYRYARDIKFILIPPDKLNEKFELDKSFIENLKEYKKYFGDDLYMGTIRSYQPNDNKKIFQLDKLSKQFNVPLVAINDVHYHAPDRRELQDILTCIREKCTIYNAGYRLHQNAERFLKPAEEMERLFSQYPEAITNTQLIADACKFCLSELKYIYPDMITKGERTPHEELISLSWKGANRKFKNKIPKRIRKTIRFELDFIRKKSYAPYFLTVYDFVRYAKEQNILCQGRGSAANSVVCYCLGITSVDPTRFKLLFSRFMSDARDEPPDIDVDFEHERREEVIQYIYDKYGRDKAAIVATVTQVHFKGAVRDVAKAMGLSLDAINTLSGSEWEFDENWYNGKSVSSTGFKATDPHLRKVLELTYQYIDFPRQLGQHTGGFVLTQNRLSDLCPVLHARMENRTCIEWNKDDIESLGFLKVDVLALGMLTCIRKAFALAKKHYIEDLTLDGVLEKEKIGDAVYQMISNADTIGVFQIESRAQMSMLPRLRPNEFYDLVIEVAIVRPGPIQGNMVHPYLRRRSGKEEPTYPSDEIKDILKRTLGVPLFQEQAMEIAIVGANFTPADADLLRRSMATFKAKGLVSQFEEKMISGMKAKGYSEEFAKRVFKQLEGFGSYGFPESHAVSFALLVYVSSWLKCYYPDVFAAALLNSQPMGFYQPAQIISDAKKHGVKIRPVDISYSEWDNTLEEWEGKYCSLRLGFRQVNGLNKKEIEILIAARKAAPVSIDELAELGISISALEKLADADAFTSISLNRREASWEISALADRTFGLYKGQKPEASSEKEIELPQMSLPEHVFEDYRTVSLSLKAHPVSFARKRLSSINVKTNRELKSYRDGEKVRVAGLVLVRQRPQTAGGICFITLEDETDIANLVVFENLFNKFRKEIVHSRLLMVEGKLQKEGDVIHVVVQKCEDLTKMFASLEEGKEESKKNEAAIPKTRVDAMMEDVFYKGRNFR